MPSLGQAGPAHWAQMRASTRMSTYEVFEILKASPTHRDKLPKDLLPALDDMLEGKWLIEDNCVLAITDAGWRHLRG